MPRASWFDQLDSQAGFREHTEPPMDSAALLEQAPEPEPEPAEVHGEQRSSSSADDAEFRELLEQARLTKYYDGLRGLGVDLLEDLQYIESDNLKKIGFREVEIKRLKQALGAEMDFRSSMLMPGAVQMEPIKPKMGAEDGDGLEKSPISMQEGGAVEGGIAAAAAKSQPVKSRGPGGSRCSSSSAPCSLQSLRRSQARLRKAGMTNMRAPAS